MRKQTLLNPDKVLKYVDDSVLGAITQSTVVPCAQLLE